MTVRRPPPDARGDGDGWTTCALGHRHWGLHGAAGLLLHRPADGTVLLQHRAEWSHHGGTWGVPGGARSSAETAVEAAVREAGEEAGVDGVDVGVHGRHDDAHGGWTYTTVIADAGGAVDARPTGGESIDVAWVGVEEVAARPLHPGFAAVWPQLRRSLSRLDVVVDAANVVGSRPDGWWRDRVGAARRLLAACSRVAHDGLDHADLPEALDLPPLTRRWPHWTAVVEGAARAVAQDPSVGIDVVAAPRSGDDAIVDAISDGPVLVVTADRELAQRCRTAGGAVVGPRWLLRLIDRL